MFNAGVSSLIGGSCMANKVRLTLLVCSNVIVWSIVICDGATLCIE
jgi:hypothetical protein